MKWFLFFVYCNNWKYVFFNGFDSKVVVELKCIKLFVCIFDKLMLLNWYLLFVLCIKVKLCLLFWLMDMNVSVVCLFFMSMDVLICVCCKVCLRNLLNGLFFICFINVVCLFNFVIVVVMLVGVLLVFFLKFELFIKEILVFWYIKLINSLFI